MKKTIYSIVCIPVGTIAVGVAGGLIGSCTEYILDKVWTKIFG